MLTETVRHDWRDTLAHLRDWRVLRIGLLGFSSGLPLLLVFGTLSFWLREAGVDRSTIGFISWVALAYALKVFWSPLVDRLPIPLLTRRLGRRRAWLLLTQATIAVGLVAMALSDPAQRLSLVVWLALLVAFASATQDVAVDAYRIESAEKRLQGIMAAFYTTGYRIAMFIASAGALWIAAIFDPDEATYQQSPWLVTYLVMAALMAVGILTTLLSPEPPVDDPVAADPGLYQGSRWQRLKHWFLDAVWAPFADFFRRHGWLALLVLGLIASYRISDIVLGAIANVFYRDMGFAKDEIALVSKGLGIYLTIAGGFLGGMAVYRYGVMPVLFVGALLASATNLLFAWLAGQGHDFWGLVMVVGMDNLSGGVAIAAFVAYLSGLVNVSYSATQYALFSSVMLLLPKFLGGFSGVLVDRLGYPEFFVLTTLMGVPVLLLVLAAWRYTEVEVASRD
ncbi:MAG: MFS transporter [Gammaproteobacteria bacterium]|nr:MAG: MFS transporter [Gammaproteobacteria bacterium]